MTWREVCDDPSLQNLPYKVELDRLGRILMSPHRKEHGAFQGEIGVLLKKLMPPGTVISECAIDTTEGVRVADVAWASKARWRSMSKDASCSVAPEICVEVTSFSNTEFEIDEKRRLYHAAGAVEVWVCDADGRLFFHDASGALKRSLLCPKFPARIRL